MSEAPVVLLWGESLFLLREDAGKLLRETRLTEVDAAGWTGGEIADLSTPSLFGEARGLLVTDAQHLTDAGVAEIRRYAEEPAGARLVLTVTVGPRAKGPPASLTRALGEKVEIRRSAVDRKELPRWVAARAKAQGIPVTPAGAAALVDTVGEDPAVLHQSVLQLARAHPETGLTPATVAAQFRGFGDRRVWELCDAAFGKDIRAALRHLAAMLDAREEPLAILGGLVARLRDLMRVRALPPRIPAAELARAAGLRYEWQARRFRDQAARFSQDELGDLHAGAVEADRTLKLGAAGDVVLSRLLVRIASPGERAG